MSTLSQLWQCFKIRELTHTVRQKGDTALVNVLNRARKAVLTEDDENLLKSRIIDKCDVDYPWDALHIFAENSCALKHNMLRTANQSQTCGLSSNLLLKSGARVLLTSNIDISDRLINGQIGTITKFQFVTNGTINKIYIRFDDTLAGAKSLPSGRNDEEHNPVAIEKIKGHIKLKRSSIDVSLGMYCS